MKLKKLVLMTIIIFLVMILASTFQASNAATGSKYLTITKLRADGYGYEALEKSIWEIVETDQNGGTINHDATIYCIKAGPGFGSAEMGSEKPTVRQYTRFFDMKNPSEIPAEYQEALPDINSNTYKSLVWLLENVYVSKPANPNDTEEAEAEEYKQMLFEAAGIDAESPLTESDIDVVQQLAIWHFTNTGSDYDVEKDGSQTFELYVNLDANDDSNYIALSDEDYWGIEGRWRAEDAEKLYQYLVNTATEQAQAGYEPQTASKPYELADLSQTVRTEGSNYIIGPFRINKIGKTTGTLEGKFTNGEGETLNPSFQNATGAKFENLEDTVGQDFYIVLPTTTNIEEINFTINGSYFNTTITYWSVENALATDQPVAIVEREKEEYKDTVQFTHIEENFDLALRKFINSVTSTNGESTPIEQSINDYVDGVSETLDNRVPQVDIEDLANGTTTTAEKIHSKTPIIVGNGYTVLYTIRVYNEGNVDAKVTEITDYLPDGLELKEDSEVNEEYGWQDNGNGTITTDYLKGTVIQAFNGTTLHYEDVQIECVVTAKTGQDDINLRNVAEITGATNSEDEEMPDRDSTPDNLTDDQIENYNPNPVVPGTGYEDDDDYEDLVIPGQYFDLALRKFITGVNDKELVDTNGNYLRAPVVDTTLLEAGSATTAIYNHPKEPVGVYVGDEIIYTIRVYNEGQIDGYVYEITDYLPANLEFVNDEFNASYGWTISSDGRTVTTDITSPDTEYSASRDTIYENRKEGSDKVILEAFDGNELDYIDVKIKCRVKDTAVAEEKLTNIAEVSDSRDSEGNEVTDRDSNEDNVTLPTDETLPNYKDDEINRGDQYIPGQEDDDDFDKVIIQQFDLALRKFITGVNENVITNREPVFSIENDKYVYNHTKEPIEVATGDIVTYTLRVYNEGDIAGYAEKVKDDIPEGLEFLPDNTTNINYRWVMYDANGEVTENVSEAVTIRTDYLSKAQEDETGRNNLIEAFDEDSMDEPDYKEVRIAFRVIEPNTSDRIIINTAEISEDSDEDGNPVDDIDSTPDNDEDGEDDIDIEKVKVTYFDLALRKFITGVNDQTITNRVPVFSIENGEYVYNHTKEPVEVANGDIVIYTIRVYNEGTQAGYAEEVKDDLPEGLEFLPDNEINTEYRWVMYDANGEVTENVSEADTIRTDYLSKAQEDETGRDNLIEAFDPETMTMPDYKEVRIAFRVTEPNTSDRVLINTAEVSEDSDEDGEPVDDIDSTPDNDEDGEDDIDKEQVKVTYFDLALKKIISEVTMTLDGKTEIKETGHSFEDDPEGVVKIELGKHKIEDAIIKFTYQIRITNEGNKAGYAYEIKDYVPEGLEFVAEDNNEHWTLSEDGKTVTSDELADTLLEPGESAIIEITFRWINGHNNLGVKTNWAEISEDSDDDIDSTPDNFEMGEDDIDDAQVVLSVTTGIGEHYGIVITAVLAVLAGGTILIKKFVL